VNAERLALPAQASLANLTKGSIAKLQDSGGSWVPVN